MSRNEHNSSEAFIDLLSSSDDEESEKFAETKQADLSLTSTKSSGRFVAEEGNNAALFSSEHPQNLPCTYLHQKEEKNERTVFSSSSSSSSSSRNKGEDAKPSSRPHIPHETPSPLSNESRSKRRSSCDSLSSIDTVTGAIGTVSGTVQRPKRSSKIQRTSDEEDSSEADEAAMELSSSEEEEEGLEEDSSDEYRASGSNGESVDDEDENLMGELESDTEMEDDQDSCCSEVSESHLKELYSKDLQGYNPGTGSKKTTLEAVDSSLAKPLLVVQEEAKLKTFGPTDRALQCLLWHCGIAYDLMIHQFVGVRKLAGVDNLYPLSQDMVNNNIAASDWEKVLRETKMDDEQHGVLMADVMGLGKTVQAVVACMLRNAIRRAQQKEPQPTIIISPNFSVQNQWAITLLKAGVSARNVYTFNPKVADRALEGSIYVLLNRYQLATEMKHLCNLSVPKSSLFPNVTVDLVKKLKNQYLKRSPKSKKRDESIDNIDEDLDEDEDEFFEAPDEDGEAEKGGLVPIDDGMCVLCEENGPRHYAHDQCLQAMKESTKKCPSCTRLIERAQFCTAARQIEERREKQAEATKAEPTAPKIDLTVDRQVYRPEIHGGFKASAKLERIMKELESFPEDDKVLILSFFKGSLDLLECMIHDKGYEYARFDGDLLPKERQEELERFRREESCRILMMSVQTGGTGLQIAEANRVIFVDRWFNPFVHEQAEDRCHRIGQKKDVFVSYMDCAYTIDGAMRRLNSTKSANANILLADGNTSLGVAGNGISYQELTGVLGNTVRAMQCARLQLVAQRTSDWTDPLPATDVDSLIDSQPRRQPRRFDNSVHALAVALGYVPAPPEPRPSHRVSLPPAVQPTVSQVPDHITRSEDSSIKMDEDKFKNKDDDSSIKLPVDGDQVHNKDQLDDDSSSIECWSDQDPPRRALSKTMGNNSVVAVDCESDKSNGSSFSPDRRDIKPLLVPSQNMNQVQRTDDSDDSSSDEWLNTVGLSTRTAFKLP